MSQSEEVLRSLGHAVIATDLAGIVLVWNPAAEHLYGWTAEEAVGRPIQSLTVPEPLQVDATEILRAVEDGRSWTGAFTVRRKDGTLFPGLVTDTGLRDEHGALVGVVGVSVNFGEAVRPFLQRSREAMLVVDRDATIHLISPGMTALTGWDDNDLLGSSWWTLLHEDDLSRAQAAHAATLTTSGLLPPVEHRLRRADGSWLWVDTVVTDLLDEPMVHGILLTLRDVGERRMWTEELTRRALYDDLTGLVNRAVFMEQLAAHVAGRQHAGAVLYVDLDEFKSVNDRFGHDGGDLVLRTVAQRLRESMRPEDVCGRLGGDEFAVLSPSITDARQALALAQRVSRHVSTSIHLGKAVIRPKASVGVTLLSGNRDPNLAIRLADEDMYAHKRRNQH